MKILAALTVLAATLATPCLAGPAGTEGERNLAMQLDLEPGKYSVNELYQIRSVVGAERADRIKLIDAQHERFRASVRSAFTDEEVRAILATRGAN